MAYLDRIPGPVRALAAVRTDAAEGRTLLQWAAVGTVLALLLGGGLLRRAERRLAERGWPAWSRSLGGAAAAAFAAAAARLLADGLSILWHPAGERGVLSLAERFAALPATVLVGTAGLGLILSTLRAAPRWGWAGLSAATALILFALVLVPPVALAPGVRGDRPAAGPAAAALLTFVRQGGLPAAQLHQFKSDDPAAVDMEGLGPLAHAAVSRAALASPRPETYAAIGHLLGHYRHADLWSLALLGSGFAAAFFFAAARAARTSMAAGASGAAVIGLVAWGAVALATPAFNLFDQAINYRADDYALGLTHDPDGLCRWLIATQTDSKADPARLEALLFYDHPPLKARLVNALGWTAAGGL